MAEDMGRESNEERARRRVTDFDRQPEREQGNQSNQSESSNYSSALLGDSRLGERGNSSVRTTVMRGAQSTHGNRAVQRFMQGSGAAVAEPQQDDEIARRIENQAGSGGKLPANVQTKLEEGMGADLSGVRIHTGGEADQLARSMNAVAFTTGSDIFFQEGKYDPTSEEGLKLLAHETTHTIQQDAGPVEGTPSAGGVSISNPSDTFEQEAERTAQAVVSGGKSDVAGEKSTKSAGGASVQRFTEPTSYMSASPFVEPTPWAGHGGRHSDWNGMPSGPNIGVEPGPGAGWAQAPHTPAPQIDNPAFPGGGPFFNPTPNIPMPDINFPTLPLHPMAGGGTGAGWQPSGMDEAPGPWAYYKQNKQGGYEDGFGAFHGEGHIGGVPVSDDLLYGHGKAGAWDDGQGGTRYGIGGDMGVANWSINQGGMVSGQAEALTASAEASWGDSGATLGAQATAVGGSMTFGGDPTKGSDQDESVRLGLSEGIGLAGRLHWGDKDGDGHREYGLGADFGPFSFDLKSEDPLRTLAKSAAGPMMSNLILGDGNATDKAAAYAGQAWDTTKEFAGEAGKYATNAYEGASSAVSGAYDTATNAVGGAYDSAASTLGGAYDAVSDYLPW